MEEISSASAYGHTLVGIRRGVSLAIRRDEIDTCGLRLACGSLLQVDLQLAHGPAIHTPSDFDFAFFAAYDAQQAQIRQPMLVRDVDDPLGVWRPARIEVVPIAVSKLVGLAAL